MKDSFPAEEEGITLSHTFLEMGQRRPWPPKKLESKGPQDYPDTLWPWSRVRDQNSPHEPQASHTPSLTLPDTATGLGSWLRTSNNSRRHVFSHSRTVPFCSRRSTEGNPFTYVQFHPWYPFSTVWVPVIFIKWENTPEIPPLAFWPFGLNNHLSCTKYGCCSEGHIPSTLGTCKMIEYYLKEASPKEAWEKEGVSLGK